MYLRKNSLPASRIKMIVITVRIELTPPLKVQKPRFGEGGFIRAKNRAQILTGRFLILPEFEVKFVQIFRLREARPVTKTSRFPLKETVCSVKNTPNFRGASRRFNRGVFISSKDLAQILVGGGFNFARNLRKSDRGGFKKGFFFNSIPTVIKGF